MQATNFVVAFLKLQNGVLTSKQIRNKCDCLGSRWLHRHFYWCSRIMLDQ